MNSRPNGHANPPLSSACLGWNTPAVAGVPYKFFYDQEVYELEQRRVFRGPVWNYVALESEIPNSGDFKANFVGDTPTVVSRGRDGAIHAFVNRCAHRGALVCREMRGNSTTHVCIYHQWSYDLEGNLIGVPFRRGLDGKGGYAAGFETAAHGLQKLRTASYGGLVFATFDRQTPPLVDYLGDVARSWIDRTLNRPVRALGYSRQLIDANWKLYAENVRDPYHGSLLHLFNATFGIARVSQRGGLAMDPSGGHNVIYARKRTQEQETRAYSQEKIRSYQKNFALADPSLLQGKPDPLIDTTTAIQTIFPVLVIQQIANSLAVRQIVPKGPSRMELVSTFITYADDDEATVNIRLKQANLAGPAGYISMEDGYAIELVQQSIVHAGDKESFIELGGTERPLEDDLVSESPIRGFWHRYRGLMTEEQ
jgi:phenylpropionate dioxygenase-like ring-hydroxylating dioxygenase large terminal subunit